MKRALINGTYDIWVPDNVAKWDAITSWERPRIASIMEHLQPGDTLYDIGVEHGWMSVIFGLHVGGDNMVLAEPSPEFWPNIRMGWEMNNLADPAACWPGFVGEKDRGGTVIPPFRAWPGVSDGPECDAMAYRTLFGRDEGILTLTIDTLRWATDRAPTGITIDIEGAELLAIRGATQTLLDDKPLVWVSVHPDLMQRDFGHATALLFEAFDAVGYAGEHLVTDHEEHWLFTHV